MKLSSSPSRFPRRAAARLAALCLAAAFLLPAAGRERRVSPVPCLLSTAQFGALAEIRLSDTATVVHLVLLSARVQEDSLKGAPRLRLPSGEELPLRHATGWHPDEAYRLGRQQTRAAVWNFPPLPRGEKEFDLCGETQLFGPFCFYGIRPKPRRPLLRRPQVSQKDSLPRAALCRDTATLRIRLLGYRRGMPRKLHYSHFAVSNGFDSYLPGELPLDAAGCATLRLPMLLPGQVSFNLGNGLLFSAQAAPGRETQVEVDLALAHERTNSLQTAACPAPADGKTARFTPVRYGGYLAGLQNFLLDPPPSLRCGPDSLPARIAALEVPRSWKQYLQATFDLAKADPALNPEAFLPLPCLNDPQSLLLPGYAATVACLPEGFLARYAAAHGARGGVLFDVHRLTRWMRQLHLRSPLTAAQADSLSLLPPDAREEAAAAQGALLRRLRQNEQKEGYEIIRIDPAVTDADALLAILLEPLRGKTVAADLWETWCRPCLLAHQSLRPLKEELEDEPVVWLYLSSASSPEPLWRDMICDIPGLHVRLTRGQAQALYAKYGLRGVPTYLVFSPGGTLRYRHTGYPGADALRNAIRQAAQTP